MGVLAACPPRRRAGHNPVMTIPHAHLRSVTGAAGRLLPWWCCHGWRWPSLVCALDVACRCRVRRVCDWHDRTITDALDVQDRTTVLGWSSPWSGDEYDPVPRSYWVWYWLYRRVNGARHRVGVHGWRERLYPDGTIGSCCDWCGAHR